MAYFPGSQYDRQSRAARISQGQDQLSGPLNLLLSPQPLSVFNNLDWPNPRLRARSRDYTWLWSTVGLIGQDTFFGAPGQVQDFDWPNPRVRPIRQFIDQANTLVVISTPAEDQPPGKASLDGQYRKAPRARDYTFAAWFPQELIGQDAMAPGKQELDSQYRKVPRSRDYTIAAWFPLELIGQDRIYGGPGQVPTYDWKLPIPRRDNRRTFLDFPVNPSNIPAAVPEPEPSPICFPPEPPVLVVASSTTIPTLGSLSAASITPLVVATPATIPALTPPCS